MEQFKTIGDKVIDLKNEFAYLTNIAKKGGGSTTWARQQAEKYGIDLDNNYDWDKKVEKEVEKVIDPVKIIERVKEVKVAETVVNVADTVKNVVADIIASVGDQLPKEIIDVPVGDDPITGDMVTVQESVVDKNLMGTILTGFVGIAILTLILKD